MNGLVPMVFACGLLPIVLLWLYLKNSREDRTDLRILLSSGALLTTITLWTMARALLFLQDGHRDAFYMVVSWMGLPLGLLSTVTLTIGGSLKIWRSEGKGIIRLFAIFGLSLVTLAVWSEPAALLLGHLGLHAVSSVVAWVRVPLVVLIALLVCAGIAYKLSIFTRRPDDELH